MLGAGIDTTSSALKGMLYCLAKNPEKQQILREEVLRALPSKKEPMTNEKLQNLPYLRACMKEQHRVQPVTVGNIRRTPTNVVLQGYQIPEGTDVFLNHRVAAQSDDHFGRPSDFIPERWLKDETSAKAVGCPHSKDAHAFAYMPFGFGNRACIGKRFADLEIALLTTRMVREFEMTWNHPEPKVESHFLRSLTGDFKIKLTDVNV